MARRLSLVLVTGCILASSPALAGSGSQPGAPFDGRGSAVRFVMQLADDDPRLIVPNEGQRAPEAVVDVPAQAMPLPAPIGRPPVPRPRSATELPSSFEMPPIDVSQLLWIVIGLLAIVGLALAMMSRLKSSASANFEIEPTTAVRSKIEAALDAALSAQSGPARAQPDMAVQLQPAPALPKATVRVDRPLVIPDNRPRFGKRS